LSKSRDEDANACLTPPENAAIIATLFEVEAKENKLAHRVVLLQMLAVLIATAIVYSVESTPDIAIAVLSGGGVSVVNGALLAWRMYRAALSSVQNAHHQLRIMYFYAAERFLVVATLLGLCIVVIKFSPLALLSGFILGQAVLMIARLLLIRNID